MPPENGGLPDEKVQELREVPRVVLPGVFEEALQGQDEAGKSKAESGVDLSDLPGHVPLFQVPSRNPQRISSAPAAQ